MKKFTFIAAICLVLAATINAQTITPLPLKQARIAVYDWVEEYLACSYLSDKYDISNYRRLFANNEVEVTNDYLPLTNDEQLVLSEYLELYSNVDAFYIATIETHKESTHVLSEILNSEFYICNISVGKTIAFADSTKKYCYPPKDYVLNIELQYDFKSEKMKCTAIRTTDLLYVDGVLHADDGSNIYIMLADTIDLLSKNENDLAIVSTNIRKESFDNKMILLCKDTTRHKLHFGASVGVSFLSHGLLNGDFVNYSDGARFSWDVNVGMYHQLLFKGNHRLGVEYSLMYRSNGYGFGGNYNISYNTVDLDGGNYLRQVSVSDYKENIKVHSLSIPIALRYDNFILPELTIFGSLGAYISYDVLQYASATAQTEYSGYYDWLFYVTINQNGIYDFGSFTISPNATTTAFKKFNVGILAVFGIQYFIPKSKWSIEPSVRYQSSLYTPIIHKTDFHLTENNSNWQSATHLFNNAYKHNIQFQFNVNYNF